MTTTATILPPIPWRYRVTVLPNGLVQVFDRACAWSTCYRVEQGTAVFEFGQNDSAAMRRAAESVEAVNSTC